MDVTRSRIKRTNESNLRPVVPLENVCYWEMQMNDALCVIHGKPAVRLTLTDGNEDENTDNVRDQHAQTHLMRSNCSKNR